MGSEAEALNRLVAMSLLSYMLLGYDTGVVSGVLVMISDSFQLEYEQKAHIVHSTVLVAMAASFVGGFLGDWYGRKPIMMTGAVFFIVCPAAIAMATSYETLVASRAVLGVGVGFTLVSVPIYIAEVAPQDTRGYLVDLAAAVLLGGELLAGVLNGVAWWLGPDGWRCSIGVASVLAVLQLALLLRSPESPRWLLTQGRGKEAEEILRSLLPSDAKGEASCREELAAALKSIEVQNTADRTLWCSKRVLRSIVLGLGLQMLSQLAGINAFMYYGASILVSVGFDKQLSIWLACVCNLALCVGVVLQLQIIDRLGRRFTALSSSVGVVASLLVLGVAFHLSWPLLSIVCLLGYLVAFGAGLAGVPYVVNAEIFPVAIRVRCNSLAGVSNCAFNWVVSSTFPTFMHYDIASVAFFQYAAIAAVGTVWLWFYLPETAHVPLEQMDSFFEDPYPKQSWAASGFYGLSASSKGRSAPGDDEEDGHHSNCTSCSCSEESE